MVWKGRRKEEEEGKGRIEGDRAKEEEDKE